MHTHNNTAFPLQQWLRESYLIRTLSTFFCITKHLTLKLTFISVYNIEHRHKSFNFKITYASHCVFTERNKQMTIEHNFLESCCVRRSFVDLFLYKYFS